MKDPLLGRIFLLIFSSLNNQIKIKVMKSIQEAVASVQNAFPSIYTKDDVVKLLNSIQIEAPKGTAKIDKQIVKDLSEAIMDELRSNVGNLGCSEVCDLSSAEFELYGNEIQLSSVDIDTDEITRNVVYGIADVIEDFFEELEEEDEEELVTEDSE